MPRLKSQDPRSIIVPIRFTASERDDLLKQAGNEPLGTWIRERVLAAPLPHSPTPSPGELEQLPPPALEGGIPAPLDGEAYTGYERRLNIWSAKALTDGEMPRRIDLATIALGKYVSEKWKRRTNE
jgi:hypothetical protein